ncbi:MAG: hypothetical protein ACLFQX_07300 [Candidatus Kapaibacterium sp.]
MKHFTGILVLIIVLSANAKAFDSEEQTLFGNAASQPIGFYGALSGSLSGVGGKAVFINGVRAGVILNHSWAIGAGAYNLASRNIISEYSDPVVGESPMLDMNYFGIEIEYINNPESLIHIAVSTLVGSGIIRYNLRSYDEEEYSFYDPEYGNSWFFVVRPQASAEINLTEWMRAGLAGGYRLTIGALYDYHEKYTDKTLSNFEMQFYLKFGVF